MPAGHARDSYLVRVREGEDAYLVPGLYRFQRGGSPERIDDVAFLSRQHGDESFAYKHIFGIQKSAELPTEEALAALGDAMMAQPYRPSGDSNIPAGYTYLGQFIFHDVTFMNLRGKRQFPRNLRTPALDLDSVLPIDNSALPDGINPPLGPSPFGCTTGGGIRLPEDLPREQSGANKGRPTIIDERNDTFLPLAQCHLLLVRFHNAVARWLGFGCGAHNDELHGEEWRGVVRKVWLQHFQSAVLHDYLGRLVDPHTYADVLANGRRVVAPGKIDAEDEWFPLEFAGALGRFGHSMVRDGYQPWNVIQHYFPVTVIEHFMDFSYRFSGHKLTRHGGGLPRDWVTNWQRLFDLRREGSGEGGQSIMAARIDINLAPQLGKLPQCLREEFCEGDIQVAPKFNLATANLLRGRMLKLATAQQAVIRVNSMIGSSTIRLLPAEDLIPHENNTVKEVFLRYPKLAEATPLWYYVLREAELVGGGCKLGPLGGRIVMETVHGAIESSEDSILDEPNWRPSLPAACGHYFSMADLIAFAGNPDPLGAYLEAANGG